MTSGYLEACDAGKGWDYWQQVLRRAAVGTCARIVGASQRILEMSVDHVKQRVQFGHHVGSFQAVQHHAANMVIDIDTSSFLTYQAAWMLASDIPCNKEISMSKAWASDAYQRLIRLGHQVHGGVSLIEIHEMPIFTKEAVSFELLYGDADFHRYIIADELGL